MFFISACLLSSNGHESVGPEAFILKGYRKYQVHYQQTRSYTLKCQEEMLEKFGTEVQMQPESETSELEKLRKELGSLVWKRRQPF